MARSFSSPAAFRQALERRLKTNAEQQNVPLNTLRLKFLIERLLARLFAQPNPPWLLKGGYAMELRYRPHARTTKDIDLSVGADEQAADLKVRLERIRDELQAAADLDLGDYLVFRITEPRTELLGAPQGGARFPVEALMAGRVFGGFHIDVGIGDALHGEPEHLDGEDLLAFAGIAPAQVLAIPKAQQIAEKIHAYTYPWTDRQNTRTRDLVDLLLLLERQPPDPEDVRASIAATFAARGSHPVPEVLQEPPAGWAAEFAEMAAEVQLEASNILEAFQRLSAYWSEQGLAGAG